MSTTRRTWTPDFIGECWPELEPQFRPLLADACNALNVHPDPGQRPQELAAVKGYGSEDYYEPLKVVFVTCGGLKGCWPLECSPSGGPVFEDVLRNQIFHAYQRNKRTGEREGDLPLPSDLSLPRQWVTPVPQPMSGMVR